MCGIAGVWNRAGGGRVDRAGLALFADSLAHRGPDAGGLHADDGAGLGLGHRRLAILDLSDQGRQPMSYAYGRYWVTFNGEIYNFLELRGELEALGHTLRTGTDTEVLLAAYAQWGEACQERLNGMWAFAIWDARERTLLLSRDRFGVKPLHYLLQGGLFAFASEQKAFAALDWYEGGVDPQALRQALANPIGVEAGGLCLLSGVRRLPAGYCLTLRQDGEPRLRRWWNTLDHLPRVPGGFRAQAEAFHELFRDACRVRMRSDTPVATALSGGLDSSSVLCMMAEVMRGRAEDQGRIPGDWQRAFVAVYRGTAHDEERYARKAVEHIGGTGVYLDIRAEDCLGIVDDVIYAMEDANHEIPYGPWLIYRLMRQSGVFVSLDGHAGDELLGGYQHYLPVAMADAVRRPGHGPELARLRAALARISPPGVPSRIPQPTEEQLLREVPRYFDTRPYADYAQDAPRLEGLDHLTRQLYLDTHYAVLPTILRNFDRLSMASGVEVRAPFMDWRLACLAFALPGPAKVGLGQTKRILRAAMRGLMPDSLRLRKSKVGFGNPKLEMFRSGLKAAVLDITASRAFLESPSFDGAAMRAAVERAYAEENFDAVLGVEPLMMAARLPELLSRAEVVRRARSAKNPIPHGAMQ